MYRSLRRTAVLIALGGVVLSAPAGCGFAGRSDDTSKPDGFLLHGYASVTGAANGVIGSPCLAPAAVPDIVAGAQVRVADASGKVVASTTLGAGVLAQVNDGFRCNFPFELHNLSGSRPTYQVLVADRPGEAVQTRQAREGSPVVIPIAPSTPPS